MFMLYTMGQLIISLAIVGYDTQHFSDHRSSNELIKRCFTLSLMQYATSVTRN